MSGARLKVYGWGREGQAMTADERAFVLGRYQEKFGREIPAGAPAPPVEALLLRAPRVEPPAALAGFCTVQRYDRAAHTYGKAYPDYVRAMLGEYGEAPDVVAYPRNEADIAAVIDWAGALGASLIPFGGGSSVCGGIEHRGAGVGAGKPAVTLDLRALDKVLEVDETSRAALIEAGAFGPALEGQLKPHGLTLRHFPQSFEYSTLGGWIATRSGGHFASLYTHVDDLVESLRVITPQGAVETRRLPGSGAGPSPDRLFIGSEGVLGVITRAWMRLQAKPRFRAAASVKFASFFAAAQAVRAIAQAGLYPSNCRILDAAEAYNAGAADGSVALMALAFESSDHPPDAWMKRALECCADHGGAVDPAGADAHREGAADLWRNAFIRMPYAREFLAPAGIINDTFETAITWERFESLHHAVKAATERAILEATGVRGEVTCRFTHVYPDGPAPYFSFHALGRRGALIEQWRAIKEAASDALIAAGGTITHHHAVGRDHRRWYDRQRPKLFAVALGAAKKALDPRGVMNPGALIDA